MRLAMPAFLGMFVQALYNVVNTIFVGRFVGTLGIAGLSIVFPLQMLAIGFGMMVGVGGLSLISRLLGSGDIKGAERALGNGIVVSLLLSILVTIIILPFADFWLRLIGASEAVLPYAREYLIIIISGTVFIIFSMALLSFARAEGNARVGMVAMILGAVLSIILSALFIITFDMGVTGAALATVISQCISTAYLLRYYLSGSSYLKIRISNFVPDFKILKSMFAVGVASFVQTVAGSLSAMIVINIVISYGGDYALSAFGIIQRLMIFAMMPGMVIGQGAQPIVGFNYGAGRYKPALRAIKMAAVSSTILSILVFLIFIFTPEPMIKIFSNDPELVAVGAYAAKLIFLAMPLIGVMMLGIQMFQAIGKAVRAFITAIVRPIVFLIPLVLTLPRFWQLDGVWLSFPLSDTLTFIFTIVLLTPMIRDFMKAAAVQEQERVNPETSNQLLETAESSRTIK